MQRYGQLSAKSPAKPPPEQNCDFIMIMLLAWSQIQSGGMLWSEGILRTGEELLHISQKSKKTLLQTYADQHAVLTTGQVLMLKKFRFCAFLWAKLLGKQSWQPCQMRFRPDVLRNLMKKCIPRIRITSIKMPIYPVTPAWQLTGPVGYYDPSGFIYNGRSHDWSSYHHHIKAITSHSKHPWIALMHSDGNVWIGRIDDPDNFFRVIHSPKNEDEKATAIAFHPVKPLIAVAVKARIIVYNISPHLKPELHFAVSFYESGYFCPRPKFSADKLDWNPTGTLLTASSDGNLSMCWSFDPATSKFSNGFNGGTKYAELCSFEKVMSPCSSCFSVDGNLAMTTYSDGTFMTRRAVHTAEKGLTLSCLKISDKVLPGQIDKIVSHPHDPSVFAIGMSRGLSHSSVLIALVNHDGSVKIIATIPDAKSPHFHEDWLLVSSGNKILFHHMNRCNIPYLVTEFQLPDNGMMHVEIGAFCVITTPDGKVMLYYSIGGESKLYKAEIKIK